MMSNRIGDLTVVKNKNKHRLAKDKYFHVRLQKECGEETSALFTEKEIERALQRAKKNPEDLPKVSFLRDLLD